MKKLREKWASWPFYRQAMLAATVGLMVFAAVFYLTVGRQQGIECGGSFYAMTAVDATKLYAGNAHEWQEGNTIIQSSAGREEVYAVTPTSTGGFRVECQIGEETFGPYQVEAVDPADLPAELAKRPLNGGMEIKNVLTGETLFRGGYIQTGGYAILLDEQAKMENGSITFHEPSAPKAGPGPRMLYRLTFGAGDSLTQRGNWLYFFYALLFAAFNTVDLLYAEELFGWRMSFRVADPEKVKPAEWELFTRHAGWAAFLVFEIIFVIAGMLSGT